MAADLHPLIEAHLRSLRAAGATERTIEGRGGVLARADRSPHLTLGVAMATTEEIEAYIGGGGTRARELAPRTRAIYWHHLRQFYRWAVARGHLDWDPMQDLTRPRTPRRVPRPITDEQLGIILARTSGAIWLASVLAAYSGLRCCEIAGLRREDVTQDVIWVRAGKGGHAAEIDAHPVVWRIVARYEPGLLIPQAGGVARAQWLSRTATRRYRKAGLPAGTSLHRLRHWHATRMRDSGADSLVIQQAMRHASLSTTAGYTAVRREDRLRAVQSLPDLTGAA